MPLSHFCREPQPPNPHPVPFPYLPIASPVCNSCSFSLCLSQAHDIWPDLAPGLSQGRSALEPSQGCGRSRRAASVQPSSSTGTRCLWYNYQIWKLFHSLCMMIVCFAVPIICHTSIMHACIMSNHVPPHVTHECCVGGILGFAPARAFTRRANEQLGLKDYR